MIMIFMLSLLGVSAMRNSTLEQQMTVNAILASDVLQAAESASEVVLNDAANIGTLLGGAAGDTLLVDSPLGDDGPFESRAVLRYTGSGNLSGFSSNAAQDGGSYGGQRFEAIGQASLPAVRVTRQVAQGLIRPIPK